MLGRRCGWPRTVARAPRRAWTPEPRCSSSVAACRGAALARHATSKIHEAADLIGVGTFGFRGEALPAIASVSRFELETSPDGRSGTRIRVTGGKRDAAEDAVRQRGTTVAVRALFFNTPARRKFLRAQATETRAVVEALTVLALARPDVAFALTSDDRALLDVPPADGPLARLRALR